MPLLFPIPAQRILRTAALACLLLASSSASPHLAQAQEQAPPGNTPTPPAFGAKVAELQTKYDEALARLDADAITEYEALKARYGESGNLDAAIWAANRAAALKNEPPLPGGNPDAAPKSDPIEEKRQAARARFGQIYVAEAEKLFASEITRLEEETKRLTIAGDLDNAQKTANSARQLAARIPKIPPDAAGQEPPEHRSHRIPEEIAAKTFTFQGHTYYLIPKPLTYPEAIVICEKLGGSLLSLDTEEKYDYFHRFSTDNGKPLWTDLNDEDEDLSWHHSNGREAQFFRWQPGEPNGGDSQKHVMIGYQGSWHMRDVNDDERFFAICRW